MTCGEHTGLVERIAGLERMIDVRLDSVGKEIRDMKKTLRWLVIVVFSLAVSVGGVKVAQEILKTAPVAASDVVVSP